MKETTISARCVASFDVSGERPKIAIFRFPKPNIGLARIRHFVGLASIDSA
jgi:hypothetical protein